MLLWISRGLLLVLLSPAAGMRLPVAYCRRAACGLMAGVAGPGFAYAQERVGADGRIVCVLQPQWPLTVHGVPRATPDVRLL